VRLGSLGERVHGVVVINDGVRGLGTRQQWFVAWEVGHRQHLLAGPRDALSRFALADVGNAGNDGARAGYVDPDADVSLPADTTRVLGAKDQAVASQFGKAEPGGDPLIRVGVIRDERR